MKSKIILNIKLIKTKIKAEDKIKAETDSEDDDGITFSTKNNLMYCDNHLEVRNPYEHMRTFIGERT